LALNASAEVNGNPEITKFMEDYYAAFQNARLGSPTLNEHDVLDLYTADAVLYVHPNFVYGPPYTKGLDESPYYAKPPNCDLPGISCGKEILSDIITPFIGQFPGMIHDIKQRIFSPEGENAWKAWLFYDYKVPGTSEGSYIVNFPGVSIFTVDLNQRRKDGKRGRVKEGHLIYDNYKFLQQIGQVT